ncbi:MAG: hypothetical protein ACJ77K_19205 [Bacteroidia bacterium]
MEQRNNGSINKYTGIDLQPWQIKNNDTPAYSPRRKFQMSRGLNGFLRLLAFFLFVGLKEKYHLEERFVSLFDDEIIDGRMMHSHIGANWFGFIGCVITWSGFIKGGYLFITRKFPQHCSLTDCMNICGPGNVEDNFDKIKNYRSSKLSTMTNNAAAKEYMKTAWVDSLSNSNDPQIKRVMSTISARLSVLSRKDGYESLKR